MFDADDKPIEREIDADQLPAFFRGLARGADDPA